MTSIRITMLLVALVVCYLLFLRTQPSLGLGQRGVTVQTAADRATSAPAAQSEYKQAMDKAHAAAKQMQAERREADSF